MMQAEEGTGGSWDEGKVVTHSPSDTFGGYGALKYVPQRILRIIEPVSRALRETKNHEIVVGVQEVLYAISELLVELDRSNLDISNLPPMDGSELDDGAFLIEWLSPNFRVGFVVEVDPKKSIWYLVTKNDSGSSQISGSLFGPRRTAALGRLIEYVAQNS